MAGNTVTMTFAGDASKLKKATDEVGASAKKMATEVGQASDKMGAAGDSGAKKFAGGLGKLKTAAGIGGAAIGVGLSAAFAKSMEFGSAQAKLSAQMGAGSDASRQAGAVAGQLYAGAYGESMTEVGDVVRTVMQSGAVAVGATDEQIQGLTGNVMSLSQAFGQDTTASVNAVAQMMKTGLAPDAQSALDILTVGFQDGNDKAGDLLDTFNEYGTQFRKMGIDGKTAMGLISQGLKAGARDSDIVADAIKEFSIRAIDGSKTTVDGFKSIGLSAQDMATKISKGGPTASAALQLTLDKLRAIKDPTERARIAVELFGTQAEDLGDALYALNPATAATAGNMGNVQGAAQKLNDTLGDTAQSKIESVKRKVEEWGASLVEVKGPIGDVGAMVAAFGPQALETLAPLGQMLVALKMQGAVGALTATKAEVAAVGATAEASSVKTGKLGGALKGLGAVVALGAIAYGMDQVNASSEGGNLSGWNGELHDLVRIMTGDWGNPLADVEAQMDATARNIQSGSSPVGRMFGWLKQQMTEPLPPLQFDVNTGPATAQVDGFINDVNGRAPQVNINGNTTGAGFALREVLAEIAAGKQSVTIDGQSIPAQEALHYVEGLVNNSVPVVDINGNNQPAGTALADILNRTNASHPELHIGAETSAAQGALNSFITMNNGRRINIMVTTTGSGGIASAGRLATGGPISGPGSGTSDTAGLYALSNGEYVATAKQVQNAGGPDAFGRLMSSLDKDRFPGMASGGPVTPMRVPATSGAGGRSSGAGAQVTFAGNTSDALATTIMQLVRTGKIQIKAA